MSDAAQSMNEPVKKPISDQVATAEEVVEKSSLPPLTPHEERRYNMVSLYPSDLLHECTD
jgi:hypothetical protein